jgi:hypothetical protein
LSHDSFCLCLHLCPRPRPSELDGAIMELTRTMVREFDPDAAMVATQTTSGGTRSGARGVALRRRGSAPMPADTRRVRSPLVDRRGAWRCAFSHIFCVRWPILVSFFPTSMHSTCSSHPHIAPIHTISFPCGGRGRAYYKLAAIGPPPLGGRSGRAGAGACGRGARKARVGRRRSEKARAKGAAPFGASGAGRKGANLSVGYKSSHAQLRA